jgi:hypothetical protein
MNAGASTYSAGQAGHAGHDRAAQEEAEKIRMAYNRMSPEAKAALDEFASLRARYEKEQAREHNERFSNASQEFKADRREARANHHAKFRANRALYSAATRLLRNVPEAGEILHFYQMAQRAIATRGKSLPGSILRRVLSEVPGVGDMMKVYSAAKFVFQVVKVVQTLRVAEQARKAAEQTRAAAETIKPAAKKAPEGEAFRAPGANTTTPAPGFAQTAKPGQYEADSLGRDLSPAAVKRAVDTDPSVSTLRDNLNRRMNNTYRDAGTAKERLEGMISRYGHTETAERIKRAPDVLGDLAGTPNSEARANAVDLVRRNVIPTNIQSLGTAEAAAARAYTDDVVAQTRFDREPLTALSAKARKAIEQIGEAKTTGERAAAYRSLMKNRSVSAEVQNYIERASRTMQGARPVREAPSVAARRVSRMMTRAWDSAPMVPDAAVQMAKVLNPAAANVTDSLRGAAEIARMVRLVNVGQRAVKVFEKLTRSMSQGRGGQSI